MALSRDEIVHWAAIWRDPIAQKVFKQVEDSFKKAFEVGRVRNNTENVALDLVHAQGRRDFVDRLEDVATEKVVATDEPKYQKTHED